MDSVKDVIKSMQESRERWCADEVDDPEEMWVEYPSFLEWAVPILENINSGKCSGCKNQFNDASSYDCATCYRLPRSDKYVKSN